LQFFTRYSVSGVDKIERDVRDSGHVGMRLAERTGIFGADHMTDSDWSKAYAF
jgi:hypothetical protein